MDSQSPPPRYDSFSKFEIEMKSVINGDADCPFSTMDYTYVNYVQSWQSLSWLDKWLKYLPMITSNSTSKEPRKHQYCVMIYIVITICCMLMCRSWRAVLGWEPNWMFDITWLVANSVDFLSRCCSIYYYYKYFQYPWYGSDNIQIRDINSVNFANKIKLGCTVIRVLFWITILLYSIGFVWEVLFSDPKLHKLENKFLKDLLHSTWFQCVLVFLTFITSFVPRVVTFSVGSAIFLKYHIYLLQLNDSINSKQDTYYTIDYKDILQEYKKIYSTFNNDYNISLNCSIQVCLFGLALFTWRNLYHIYLEKSYGFCFLIGGNILVAVLLVFYALWLTKSYYDFENSLLASGGWYMGNEKYLLNRADYQYTMDFVGKHSMEIKLGKITVTSANIIKFIAGFAIAKFVSVIFKELYG